MVRGLEIGNSYHAKWRDPAQGVVDEHPQR